MDDVNRFVKKFDTHRDNLRLESKLIKFSKSFTKKGVSGNSITSNIF
jgi:hypothetical protein